MRARAHAPLGSRSNATAQWYEAFGLPTGNACVERQDGVLFVCGTSRLHDWAPDEGTPYTPLLNLPDLRPSAWPVETPAQELCRPLWLQFAATLEANALGLPDGEVGTPALEPPPPASVPGGATTEGLLPAALLLALPLLRRARQP